MTLVRNLTDDEKVELEKILSELQAHVGQCGPCMLSRNVKGEADLATSGLCEVGQGLYRRWLVWLAR